VYTTFASAEHIVHVEGVEPSLRQQILDNLVISHHPEDEYTTTAHVRALYRQSITELRNILKSWGYYEFEIDNSLEQVDDEWIARFEITLGDPVIVNQLSFQVEGEGTDDEDLIKAVSEFPLKVDDIFNHNLYETGKSSLQTIAQRKGYFNAGYTKHVVYVNEVEKTAEIELIYDTGRRYIFGQLMIDETVVNQDRIERLIPFRQGDPYNANQLIVASQNLRNTNYFNEVVVRPELDSTQDYRVPVTVNLIPKPRHNFKIGAGYGTDSGPRIIAGWENRYLNRRGHKLETNLKASTTLNIITLRHINPDFAKTGADLDLFSSLSRETTDTHSSDNLIFGAQHTKQRWGWNETLSLNYEFENFDVGTSNNVKSNLLIPGISYWKSVSEGPIYSRSGYRLNLSLRGSIDGALSELSFFQATLWGKYIYPVGEDNRLIARADLGAIYTKDFEILPASIRYFAGGDYSIRGFDLQSQGPRNPEGEVIGGKYLGVASIEYEHRLFDKISAAVFADYGNAFNSFSDHFVYGSGVGLRWLTPVGSLRLDFAFGLSETPDKFRIHFNIGPDL
jgi:translocation and assembly module TamA